MPQMGQTRKCADVTAESALPQRTDIGSPDSQFRKVPIADAFRLVGMKIDRQLLNSCACTLGP
jgi:hypothetical protein